MSDVDPTAEDAGLTGDSGTVNLDDTATQNDAQRDRARELSLRRDEPPLVIPGYAFVKRLGDGAFGSVWLAREENTGRQVAIKFYAHRRGLDWSLLSREVEKLAVLDTSRRIVGLVDVGWDTDPPYYVMEYLENGSLDSYLADGPLPASEAVRMARAVLQGLVHAHGSGILHCDLKPANVLLDSDYEPRLCDFGQSRLSHEQNPALGTLFYMAAEQADLKAVPDARWDVYALGSLLYHMLCGAPPYRTPDNERKIREAESLEDRLAVYRRILHESPPPDRHRRMPGVDRRLVEIVDRCLQVDPTKRYPNAQAVLDRLIARDRLRERRPLIALGIIGPFFLLLAMAFIFANAMKSNVESGEELQLDAALESNALAARIQARSLETELYDRLSELEDFADRIGDRIASDTDFQATVAKLQSLSREEFVAEMETLLTGPDENDNKPEWIRLLDAAKAQSDDHIKALRRGPDTSWFLTDHRGYQVWRRDFRTETMGRNYGWRDYFNGRNREDDLQPLPPIGRGHISIPFRSEATHRYMVAMSTPVRDAGGNIVGVLGRTTHLGEIRVGGVASEQANRGICLAETVNWRLLDHPWLSATAGQGSAGRSEEQDVDDRIGSDELFNLLQLPKSVVDELELKLSEDPEVRSGDIDIRFREYRDPVGRIDRPDAAMFAGDWIAAMSPVRVRDTLWMVIVQENRADTLKPVRTMTDEAVQWGLLFLFVSMALIGPLWFFVSRALQDRGVPHWTIQSSRRGMGNGSGSGGTQA